MSDQAQRVLDNLKADEPAEFVPLRHDMPVRQSRLTALQRGQRDRRIVSLAAGGATPARIAEVMHLKVEIVEAAINRGINIAAKTPIRDIDKVRELTLQRLDTMLLAIWADVQAGKLQAIDRALKIEDQRARLGGLYAEEKQPEAHLHLHGVSQAEIESATDAWRKQLEPGDDVQGPPEPDEPSALEAFAALPDVEPIADVEVIEDDVS